MSRRTHTGLGALSTAAGAVALGALALGALTSPALAADAGYNATIAGQRNYTSLVNLAPSSMQRVDVVNLPANVGLYALHCKVPADPRSAPTLCDSSIDSLVYLTATPDARATVGIPFKLNGEFFGTDPNPTAGASVGESVDCRVDTGNARLTTCAVYVLGAGRDSANPAYMRIFPTVFSPVKADRATDVATIKLVSRVVAKGSTPKVSAAAPVAMEVTLSSGLKPTLTSDNCSLLSPTMIAALSPDQIQVAALKPFGTCTVRIVSTGGANTKPLVTTQVFQLTK